MDRTIIIGTVIFTICMLYWAVSKTASGKFNFGICRLFKDVYQSQITDSNSLLEALF